MERARPVESGFFPLDEELGLLPGGLTPTQHEHLVHLATWMPFAQAGKMLSSLLGVQVSEATVRRMTEQAGACYEQVQTAQSEQPEPEVQEQAQKPREPEEKAEAIPHKQAVSSDGAYVPLISGEWAEVRTLAIGDVSSHTDAKGNEQVKVTNLSYFSRMTDSATFEKLSQVEIQRRRVRDALSICAVTDGAIWLQHFVDLHRPDALRILDFPHAAEYVSALGEGARAHGYHLPKKWLDGVLHRLKHEGPDRVLKHLSWLCERCRDPEMDKKLRYLSSRQEMMQYSLFQQTGWPIGSGMVESANKVVMQMRLKGPGMRWEPSHVNPMLALRGAVCNERWEEAWLATHKQQEHLRLLRYQTLATPRLAHLIASTFLLLSRLRPPSPPPVVSSPPQKAPPPSSPPATLPGSSRPSSSHPWKRGPACYPKPVAKN
jgi:hypothetical protein